MPKPIRIEHLGVSGVGATRSLAKKSVEDAVGRFFNEGIEPVTVAHGNYPGVFSILFRTGVDTFGYTIFDPARQVPTGERRLHAMACGLCSRDEVMRAARRHLAQWVMVVDDDHRSGAEFIENEADIVEHLSLLATHRHYNALLAAGLSKDDAHRGARGRLAEVPALLRRFLPNRAEKILGPHEAAVAAA